MKESSWKDLTWTEIFWKGVKYAVIVVGVYCLHILIEAFVVTNILAYLGYTLPVFV
jgi:hypothetical protein